MKGNARNETEFDHICINRQTLETGNSVKLLGTVRLLRPSGGAEVFRKVWCIRTLPFSKVITYKNCTFQTGRVCYNAININYVLFCLCMCRIARELNLSSVMVLCKGVCGLFIPLKLRSAVHVRKVRKVKSTV